MVLAAANCDGAVMEALLANPRIDPSVKDNAALRKACRAGNAAAVERLVADPRVDAAAGHGAAIVVAAEGGSLASVKRLLAHPGINPAMRDNAAIIGAAGNGHADVVARLMRDSRVNPAAQYGEAIRAAAAGGHLAAVNVLLAYPRINPEDTLALSDAARLGHAAVVDRLLADPRVKPGDMHLADAIQEGHAAVVERLWADPRIVPSARHVYFTIAARTPTAFHVQTLKRLLDDPRFNGSDTETLKRALGSAVRNERRELAHCFVCNSPDLRRALQPCSNETEGLADLLAFEKTPEGSMRLLKSPLFPLPAPLLNKEIDGLRMHGSQDIPIRRMRSLVSISDLAAAAWARRRPAVLARAVALAEAEA